MIGAVSALAGALSANSPLSPAKLELQAYGPKKLELKGDLLNPTEISLDRKNAWQSQRSGGGSQKPAEANGMTFAGGEDSLTLSFLLDASELPKVDLQDDMKSLYGLTKMYEFEKDGQKVTRPPVLVAMWGAFVFTGVAESVTIKVTLFDHNAKFKRANVTITMKGSAFEPGRADYLDKPPAKIADKAETAAVSSKKKGGGLAGLF